MQNHLYQWHWWYGSPEEKKQRLNRKLNLAYSFDFDYIIAFLIAITKGFLKDPFIHLEFFQIQVINVPASWLVLAWAFRKHIMKQFIIIHALFSSMAETFNFFFSLSPTVPWGQLTARFCKNTCLRKQEVLFVQL